MILLVHILILILAFACVLCSSNVHRQKHFHRSHEAADKHAYDLPCFPESLVPLSYNMKIPDDIASLFYSPPSSNNNSTKKILLDGLEYNKKIPRHIWIAVKDYRDRMPDHMYRFLDRNPQWDVHICDNRCKDLFMNRTMHNTSLLWMYHLINPVIGAARADIWRYVVLYIYGGFYIDDDSDMKTPLDEVLFIFISNFKKINKNVL